MFQQGFLLFVILLCISQIAHCVPTYVMMPLNVIDNNLKLNDPNKLKQQLSRLKNEAQCEGIMLDVWWGLVEKEGNQYEWGDYGKVFALAEELGLGVQVVMSTHQCGGNVGDTCNYPLPQFVRNLQSEGVFYQDQQGWIDLETLSWVADSMRVFPGNSGLRTGLEVYQDYYEAFRSNFQEYMGTVIKTVEISLGPAGELRYPSYPLQNNRWSYPGVGQFQAYNPLMLQDLKEAATNISRPEWGNAPPNDAGHYKDLPTSGKAPFFMKGTFDNFESDYGKFFLGWYSQKLIEHGDNVLRIAQSVFKDSSVTLAAKVSGIHWWYKHPSHAAESTAGYNNVNGNNAYLNIAQMLKKYNAEFAFTCVEMTDASQSGCHCQSGPEELVQQTRQASKLAGIPWTAENALPSYSQGQLNQILKQSDYMHSFTYLRLSDTLFQVDNWNRFVSFVKQLRSL